MGLFFYKYVENAYCPKCEKRFTMKMTLGKYDYFNFCPDCKEPLAGSSRYNSDQHPNDLKYFYRLFSTNILIPEKSYWTEILIYFPFLIFGLIGLIPFFLFLFGTLYNLKDSQSIFHFHAIKESFLMIYGNSSYIIPSSGARSVLYRIFENDLVVYGITILSAYFSIRFFYGTISSFLALNKDEEMDKKRWGTKISSNDVRIYTKMQMYGISLTIIAFILFILGISLLNDITILSWPYFHFDYVFYSIKYSLILIFIFALIVIFVFRKFRNLYELNSLIKSYRVAQSCQYSYPTSINKEQSEISEKAMREFANKIGEEVQS